MHRKVALQATKTRK